MMTRSLPFVFLFACGSANQTGVSADESDAKQTNTAPSTTTAACTITTTEPFTMRTWSRLDSAQPNKSSRFVLDSARQRIIGYDGIVTQAWDGNAWSVIASGANKPRAIGGFLMTYDTARDRVVLFGGATQSFALNETWEFDGTTWTKQAVTGDEPMSGDVLTYDEARQVTILFDWQAGELQAVWEWDGASWTTRAFDRYDAPKLYFPSAVYAPTLGGVAAYDTRGLGTLSIWDGNGWKTGPVLPQVEIALRFDPDEQRLTAISLDGYQLPRFWELQGDAFVLVQTHRGASYPNGPPSNLKTANGFYFPPLRGFAFIDRSFDFMWLLARQVQENKPPTLQFVPTELHYLPPVVFAGETLTFSLNGTDSEQEPIIFGVANLPAGASFSQESATFTWTPAPADAGTHQVTFGASDGRSCNTRTVTIEVRFVHYSWLPDGPIHFSASLRGAFNRSEKRGTIDLTLTGHNPGKVSYSAAISVEGWEVTINGVVDSDGSFRRRVRTKDELQLYEVAGNVKQDSIGDLFATIDKCILDLEGRANDFTLLGTTDTVPLVQIP